MRYLLRAGILILIGMMSGCIKDPFHIDLFPIRANPGKFECYINGQDFVPDSNKIRLAPGGPVMAYVRPWNNGNYQIIIYASTSGLSPDGRQEVGLQIQNVPGVGIYEFDDPNYQYAVYTKYPVLDSLTAAQQIQPAFYNAPKAGHGILTLTRFDPQNSVIAGTFAFSAASKTNPADSVKVTGGHFNINYANQ